MENDTIAAIATAINEAGIGIIRISGVDAILIANQIFFTKKGEQKLSTYHSHTIHYGYIKNKDEVLDEVMISIMKAPNSFTKEDVVEINCHGGVLLLKNVLNLVIEKGARLAEPGEFTKRAFLNGRIDLSEAEAVMDLISSKSNIAVQNSLKQLNGQLFEMIKAVREKILFEIAYIESALDDPEHISLEGYSNELLSKLDRILITTEDLIATASKGKLLKEGIRTVIAGKPNVGKSSLLNALVGRDTAIVTEIEGTTRDIINEQITLGNISLNLTDTAGIRDTKDIVENIGVTRAKEYIHAADLILFIVDVSREITNEDEKIIKFIQDKKVILLWNKTDKKSIIDKAKVRELFENKPYELDISAKERIGIAKLEQMIKTIFMAGDLKSENEIYITNLRQENELKEAAKSIRLVKSSIENGMTEDFYTIDLMNAYSSFGKIVGEDIDDDLVKEIFSKFCMGK